MILCLIFAGSFTYADETDAFIYNCFSDAQNYYREGKWDNAEKELKKILKVRPEHKESIDYLRLIDNVRKSIKDNLAKGKGSFDGGSYFSARASFQEVLKLEPDNSAALSYIKKIDKKEQQIREEQSQATSTETVKTIKHQTLIDELLKAVKSKYDAGYYDESLNLCNRVLQIDPENKDAKDYIRLRNKSVIKNLSKDAMAKYRARDYKDAIKVFLQILELDPTNNYAREYINTATEKILEPERQQVERERARLMKEAEAALKAARKEAAKKEKVIKPIFKAAKKDYDKKRFLKASDKFRDIMLKYPDYEMAKKYYQKINDDMDNIVRNPQSVSFEILAYAKGYLDYYGQNLQDSVAEWEKVLEINPKRSEIKEYLQKVKEYMADVERLAREKDIAERVTRLYNEGIKAFADKKWVTAIKKMEEVQSICKNEPFPQSLEWFSKAQDYIKKAIDIIAVPTEVAGATGQGGRAKPPVQEVVIDEAASAKAYQEGLVAYAQGRLFDAKRSWEIARRYNPKNEKAQKALERLNKEMELKK